MAQQSEDAGEKTAAADDKHHAMPSKALEDWDLDQEEKARQITEEDLNSKSKQSYKGFILLWLAWQSSGVIYGDIGTSPLYVYSSTFSTQPSWDDLVGALSIIIWSLTLIVTVKYCLVVLSADDDGQGGTFALYSLLARHANIARRDPGDPQNGKRLDRHLTGDLRPVAGTVRGFLERSAAAKGALKVIGVLGVSMVMADGVLTPAQSVLGAIQGIRVVRPDLGTDAVVGITCAILVALFVVQPLGTARVGTAFAPIVIVWLLFNLCSGIYNLAMYDHTVLKAFNPGYAFTYLIRNGTDGWKSLGGLLLAFTGVEALFADLGAFGKRAIQLSWLCLAYPCLLLAYIGQAAFIAQDATGTAFTNPFFYTVPPGSFYFSLVIAVLAAIVASQAMITSSFQLLSQVMRLSYFPHIKTVHTSRRFHEQVYMPLANWLLMIGTVIVTAVYNNTTSLGNAYGVCVIIVTMITTCMVSLVALIIWGVPFYVVLPIWLAFASLDGAYMSSALLKVPDGAWFTILLAVILSSIFILWRWGKEQQWAAEAQDRILPTQLLQLSPATSMPRKSASTDRIAPVGDAPVFSAGSTEQPQQLMLAAAYGGGAISTASGLGIFFDKSGGGPGDGAVPKVFAQFVRKFKARPDVIVFFHMRPLPQPTVPPTQRFIMTRVRQIPSCYRLTLRHGYADDVLTSNLHREMFLALANFITRGRLVGGDDEAESERQGQQQWAPRESELPPGAREELRALTRAQEAQTVYVMGKQVMRIRKAEGKGGLVGRTARWLALEMFLWIRENSRTKLADLDIDHNSLIEVGFVKDI